VELAEAVLDAEDLDVEAEVLASLVVDEPVAEAEETIELAMPNLTEAVDSIVAESEPELMFEAEPAAPVEAELESASQYEEPELESTEPEIVPAPDRLDQVLLAQEPTPEAAAAEATVDELASHWASRFGSEATPAGSPIEADDSEAEEDDEEEEVDEPAARAIPSWPSASRTEERAPLSASDAPAPPPPPTEAERSGQRPSQPSRSGPPSNPGGAPFRTAGDQLPAGRSWPTLPR
jgi:hypothetical protein